jgi:hypothetical protein
MLQFRKYAIGLIAAAGVMAGANSARAAAVFTFSQVGPNVVGTLSGSLDMTGAVEDGATPSYGPSLSPDAPQVIATPGTQNAIAYDATGPSSFGTGFYFTGVATGSGPFEVSNFDIVLPTDYSGGSLDNTLTIANETYSSMGITPGDYVFTLSGSGDTVTLDFTASSVPEPASLAMVIVFGAGLLGRTRSLCQHDRRRSRPCV